MPDISKCVLNGLGIIGLKVSVGALGQGVPPFPVSYYGYVSHPQIPITLQTSPWKAVLVQEVYLLTY